MTNENKQFEKNKIIKEEPKEIKIPNCIDKNKFREILTIIDSNKFGYKNKEANLRIMTLKTWLIILKIIQLVKQMLKNF